MSRVLIVDDDPVQLAHTEAAASRAGFTTLTAGGGHEALAVLGGDCGIRAVVLDLVMPDVDGMAVLEAMRRHALTTPVIVQTTASSLDAVATAMRHGAVDFLVKPVAVERLAVSLRNAMDRRALQDLLRTERKRGAGAMSPSDIITSAPVMERVLERCEKAARNTVPVLIEGEAGTGKELLARVIHGSSDRSGRPFVTVNCRAGTAGELDAMLFGTGPVAGSFIRAQGGTLFLDEIGDLPPGLQAKLLDAVEQGKAGPADGSRGGRANVRLIAATSQRLLNFARSGAFREDLYYRLNVFPLYVPPLRERPEDIPLLADHFLLRHAAETGRCVSGIDEAALALLLGCPWPGNVGQLESAIYRALVLAEAERLRPVDFPLLLAQSVGRDACRQLAATDAPAPMPVHVDAVSAGLRRPETPAAAPDRFLDENGRLVSLATVEQQLIGFALARHGYRMSMVARELGIGRSTLYRKLLEYGLGAESDTHAA